MRTTAMRTHTDSPFDRLFETGSAALRAGHAELSTPPLDGTPRWGVSVILRPDRDARDRLDRLTGEVRDVAGRSHWGTGNAIAEHLTVRALEPHRDPIGVDDAAVARYAAALRRTAARCGPARLALTGITLSPSTVMCCASPIGSDADAVAAVLAEELGADDEYERSFNRDIWYVTLLHFADPVTVVEPLIDWITQRRRLDLGTIRADRLELIRWAYDGVQAVPVPLAIESLRAA
jgi:hypothetical protein